MPAGRFGSSVPAPLPSIPIPLPFPDPPLRPEDTTVVRPSVEPDENEGDDLPEEQTGYCPECGAEVWDQADICPKCFSVITGGVLHRPPMERWWRGRWKVIVVVAVLVAFTIMLFRIRL